MPSVLWRCRSRAAISGPVRLRPEQVRNDIQLIARLLSGRDNRIARSRAILIFSALVGAMSLARAVSDESLSREILETVGKLLKKSGSKHAEPRA